MMLNQVLNRIRLILPLTILLSVILIVYFPIISENKNLGHIWDWGIPDLKGGVQQQFENSMYIWKDHFPGGNLSNSFFELPFWAIMVGLSHFSIKPEILLLVLVHTLAFFSTFFVLVRVGKTSYLISSLASLIYAFSPYVFTRIIAGHLTMLLGYAVLPLTIYSAIDKKSRPMRTTFLCITGLISGFHLVSFVINLFTYLITSFIYDFFEYKKIKVGHIVNTLLGALLILTINLYWIVPFLIVQKQGGYRIRSNETISEEVVRRVSVLDSKSNTFLTYLTNTTNGGLDTEFVYGKTAGSTALTIYSLPFLLIIIFIFFISSAHTSGKAVHKTLIVLLIISLGITTGNKNIIGKAFYDMIRIAAPPVFAGFSIPVRWSPVFYLFLSLGVGFIGITLIKKKILKYTLYLFLCSLILLLITPWLTNDLTRPYQNNYDTIQTLSLKQNNVHSDDIKIFDQQKNNPQDSRSVFLPPALVSWPGLTDHILAWNSFVYPKPVFFQTYYSPIERLFVDELYQPNADNKVLSTLLGYANVSEIIYPRYASYSAYPTFVPFRDDYKPTVDKNLKNINELQKSVGINLDDTDYFYFNGFLPHVYLSQQNINTKSVKDFPSVIKNKIKTPASAIFSLEQNKDSVDLIYGISKINSGEATVEYKKISPVSYVVKIHNLSDRGVLVFSETFDKNWQVYVSKYLDEKEDIYIGTSINFFNNKKSKATEYEIESYRSHGLISFFPNMNSDQTEYISRITEKTIQNNYLPDIKSPRGYTKLDSANKNHFMANGYANSWIISSSYCLDNPKICKQTKNGYDIELLLYYDLQKYFKISLMLTLISSVACVCLLVRGGDIDNSTQK